MDSIIANQVVESQYSLEIYPYWFLIKQFDLPISAGDSYIRLPNYIVSIRDAEIVTSDNYRDSFVVRASNNVRDEYPDITRTGQPKLGFMQGHILHFSPKADDSYTMRVWAHRHLDVLSEDTDHNLWTDIYRSALRFKVLCDLEAYIGADERVAVWQQKLATAIAEMKSETAELEACGTLIGDMLPDNEDIY